MKENKDIQKFLVFIRSLIFVVVMLWLVFSFAIGIKMVPNNDMFPMMKAGDIMLYYRIGTLVHAQDVVVLEKNDTDYVGRVVAVGGDTVDITEEGNLIINGNLVVEDNIFYSTPYYEGFVKYPVTLASDEYFILSDRRDGGEDSRYYGPVRQSELKGTIIGMYRRGSF